MIPKWLNKKMTVVISVISAMMMFCGCEQGIETATGTLEPLKTTIFKVGKADAIILQQKDSVMVIDAGEEEDGEEVLFFLQNQGIKKIDTLIITHYDQDHVGGADTLVEALEIGQVLLPAYEGTHTEYLDFKKALEEHHMTPEKLTKDMEFQWGDANVLVEPPSSYETEDGVEMDNNFSLITTVTHGENVLTFTGDMEKQRIREWLAVNPERTCDFLKVPHHGVYNSAMKDLFEATDPEFAAICTSNKNPADPSTVELLKQYTTSVFQTKDGNITIISDGKDLEVHQKLEK